MGMRLGENTTYYMAASFTLTYLKIVVGVDTSDVLLVKLFAHVVHLVTVPISGYLSDRLGRKPVIGAGWHSPRGGPWRCFRCTTLETPGRSSGRW